MEQKDSSPKPDLSPSDCDGDQEEKEVSEDEDDDRNHKHRKRDTRAQSLEHDSLDQVSSRPYRKRNMPFENGYTYGGGDSQSGGTLSARFDKRRLNPNSFSGTDLKYRNRGNQSMSGEAGPVRGRGREPNSWGLRDSRLRSSDFTSQLVQPGALHSSLFPGRGLPNVSNAQSTSWNAFGLVPGITNSGRDALNPLGFQGMLGPSINPAINIGIPRQRCRDFEERGFCLRGDMCPMEHGVNRIVVEDVQSLSQFNLPVSLPGSQLLGTPAGQGPLSSVNAPVSSGTLMNGRVSYVKNSKLGMTDDGLGLNGGFVGGSMTAGPDVYDPDQPLWANDHAETSAALLGLNPSNVDETESFPDTAPSDRQQIRLSEGYNDDRMARHAATAGSHNLSVWGRIGNSRNTSGLKEKIDSSITSSSNLDTDSKDLKPVNTGLHDASDHAKRINVNQNGQFKDTSSKQQTDSGHNVRNPSHKALRTLFVKGIPLKDNRKEALLSHFRKFGKVVDIYIPLNSERAFIQFSKREEAESALKAPDAVMGNRFIKLWWANRDNIPDDGPSGSSNVPITSGGVTPYMDPPLPSFPDKGKGNSESSGSKAGEAHPSVVQVPAYDHPKPVVSSSPKTTPPVQNKLESLELLKEELRKKQLMLEQKRNDFRRQLNKLEKHATGLKDVTSDLATKRLRGEKVADPVEAEASVSIPSANVVAEKPTEHGTPTSSTSNPNAAVQERPTSRPLIRPLVPLGARAPFLINRFKLDNRPTAFKIISPLPDGLSNVAALDEHFSCYGDLSSVQLEESEPQEAHSTSLASTVSACISFTTRHSAEKAFLNGKCWQGHDLRFMWITSSYSNSSKNISGVENSSVPSERHANVQSSEAVSPNKSSKNIGEDGSCAASEDSPSDANIQSIGEAVSAHDKISGFRVDQSENLTKGNVEFVDQEKDSKSSSTTISGEQSS